MAKAEMRIESLEISYYDGTGRTDNSKPRFIAIVTTIHEPSSSLHKLISAVTASKGQAIIIGDSKTPADFCVPQAIYYGSSEQQALRYTYAQAAPINHYARKNIGYIIALQEGAPAIYETDDDTAPLKHWKVQHEWIKAINVKPSRFVNVYTYFSTDKIWPRGFPLDEINNSEINKEFLQHNWTSYPASIQQCLVNGDPDVDAIWRLTQGKKIHFRQGHSIRLPKYTWSPFNSQSTWWFPAAYPFLYLPATPNIRECDIIRSLVAQRCLWELDQGIVFHAPNTKQRRNSHNLMVDFKHEYALYFNIKPIVTSLENLNLRPGFGARGENLLRCYETLIGAGFIKAEELSLLNKWQADSQPFYSEGVLV